MTYHLHGYFKGNQLWHPMESFGADEFDDAIATGQEFADALDEPVALYEYKFSQDPESEGFKIEDIYPENY